MAIFIQHYKESNFLLSIFHGSVTDRELDCYISDLLQMRNSCEGKKRLVVICKNASASHLTHQSIFNAGQRMRDSQFRKGGKLAIVAKNTVGFGLAKIYQIASEASEYNDSRILRAEDMNLAIQWLDAYKYEREIEQYINDFEQASEAVAI